MRSNNSDSDDLTRDLYVSLKERWMPEQVIGVLFQHAHQLTTLFNEKERNVLSQAKPRYAHSSMSSRFDVAKDLAKQLQTASTLFHLEAPPANDTVAVREFITTCRALIQLPVGTNDFVHRLKRDERVLFNKLQPSIPKGHRAYNKRFRMIVRMEKKYAKWQEVANMRDLAMVAHSKLATRITEEAFSKDPYSALFIAYMTARLNKRSVFTFDKQERPYDNIADLLFNRLHADSNWFAVAHVHPVPEVLDRCMQEEKGQLLGLWYSIMVRCSSVLKEAVEGQDLDLVNLIVRRGNDSSTWNEAAGAFNKARDGWIATLYSLGAESLLDNFAPGKTLRLMAADVAWGHRAYGEGLEPDTAVWNELPKPWDVVLAGHRCDRDQIEKACQKHGIEGKGWIAPRSKTVAEFKPTPELVHGVVVSSPDLAQVLKSYGYFAGPTKASQKSGYVPILKVMDGLTVKVEEP